MKKVLIITYYWPPSGGIGVHRTLKFAKYLPYFGWEPIVYAPENADYPYYDETNYKHISKDLTVIKTRIREPFNLFRIISGRSKKSSANPMYARDKKRSVIDKFAIWIRGNFFIPDARCLWIKPSVKFLEKYVAENHIDAIFSDGPPHTNTMIACKLSEATGIPWLMDFQDPWTQVDYYKMMNIWPFADKKHHKLEKQAFEAARKTTIVSPSWKKDLESIGAKNVDVIVWGYDEDDFKDVKQMPDENFSIVHAGILGFDRCPKTLIKILAELKKEIPTFAKDLKIKFAGLVDYSVEDLIRKSGLEENYQALGNIPRNQAISMTLSAQLLLLPLNIADNAKGRIPGKLFECLRAERPILCLGPNDSDVENILSDTNTGKSFEYDNYSGIKDFVIDIYEKYKNGDNAVNAINLEKYSVKNQTKILAQYLDEII